jgi:tetratricopeptide (TPR) repeat protein
MRRQRHKPPPPVSNQHAKPSPASSAPPPRKRLWLFRLLAVVLSPLLFFALLESSLRLAGVGHPVSFFLPARINGQEVFVQNDRFAWRFLGSGMARAPFPFMISKSKPPGTVRIFLFGESAAFGDPQPEFGLSRMLEALLIQRYPGTHFEVVNTAMTAINSHAIVPIARDCAHQNGDVWVIYMGNNEVVGPYGAGTVFGPKAPGLAFIRASIALKATRTGQWLDSLRENIQKQPAAKSEWGGMEMFLKNQVRQDAPGMATVYANFQRNLQDILGLGVRSGAKIVVSTVASNLKDCAPFASLHRPDLQSDELTNWNELYQKGAAAQQAGDPAAAAACFARADAVDGSFAELHFRWGWCCLAQGRDDEALRQFTLARDEDALRFRCDSRLDEIIRRTAADWENKGVLFADAQGTVAQQSPHGLVGREFLHEHVHLNFEGNYLVARTVAEQVAKSLPEPVTRGVDANRPWPSAEDCARRLAWSDWNQFQADNEIFGRINDPPFTAQLNHAEQCQWLQQQIEKLLPATEPAAMRQSASLCRDAIMAAPGDWVLRKNLALLCQETGDQDGAVESWRRVVELLPYYAAGWQSLGAALIAQNKYGDASAAYASALQLEPDNVYAMDDVAQIFVREGKDAEAMREYEQALAIKPHLGQAHLGLGMLLEKSGRKEEAQAHYQQALQNRIFTPASLNTLGEFCFQKGWFSEAATNFMDALSLNPSDSLAHVNLGVSLESLGRHAEAEAQYAEAARLDPDLAAAHYRLGLELGRRGGDAGAMEQFAETVRLKPDFLEARMNLGVALLNQHRPAEALEQFQQVLRRDPANAAALKYVQAIRDNMPAESPR